MLYTHGIVCTALPRVLCLVERKKCEGPHRRMCLESAVVARLDQLALVMRMSLLSRVSQDLVHVALVFGVVRKTSTTSPCKASGSSRSALLVLV